MQIFFRVLFGIMFYGLSSLSDAETALPTASEIDTSTQQAAQQLKTWFNINIEANIYSVSEAAKSVRHTFYANLRNCTPGTYKYPIQNFSWGAQPDNTILPLFSLGTTTISGMKDGNCDTFTTRDYGNAITEVQCKYSPATLAFFTDATVEKISGSIAVYVSNEWIKNGIYMLGPDQKKDEQNKILNISQKECKVIKNTRTYL